MYKENLGPTEIIPSFTLEEMWLLRARPSSSSQIFTQIVVAVKPNQSVKIGRKDCDISVGNDFKSVSRLHATVRSKLSENQCELELIDEGSKFGSFVNDQQIEANKPRLLTSGDVVKLGMHNDCLFDVVQVLVCVSGLNQAPDVKKRVESTAKSLGIIVSEHFTQRCSHLITPEAQVNPKVLTAIIFGKYVVTPQWLAEVERMTGVWPDEERFAPKVVHAKMTIDFRPTPRRAHVLEKSLVVFLTKKDAQTWEFLSFAGAKVIDLPPGMTPQQLAQTYSPQFLHIFVFKSDSKPDIHESWNSLLNEQHHIPPTIAEGAIVGLRPLILDELRSTSTSTDPLPQSKSPASRQAHPVTTEHHESPSPTTKFILAPPTSESKTTSKKRMIVEEDSNEEEENEDLPPPPQKPVAAASTTQKKEKVQKTIVETVRKTSSTSSTDWANDSHSSSSRLQQTRNNVAELRRQKPFTPATSEWIPVANDPIPLQDFKLSKTGKKRGPTEAEDLAGDSLPKSGIVCEFIDLVVQPIHRDAEALPRSNNFKRFRKVQPIGSSRGDSLIEVNHGLPSSGSFAVDASPQTRPNALSRESSSHSPSYESEAGAPSKLNSSLVSMNNSQNSSPPIPPPVVQERVTKDVQPIARRPRMFEKKN